MIFLSSALRVRMSIERPALERENALPTVGEGILRWIFLKAVPDR